MWLNELGAALFSAATANREEKRGRESFLGHYPLWSDRWIGEKDSRPLFNFLFNFRLSYACIENTDGAVGPLSGYYKSRKVISSQGLETR